MLSENDKIKYHSAENSSIGYETPWPNLKLNVRTTRVEFIVITEN